MRGAFITLEGPEGSGKSTQGIRLADRLREVGYEVVCTREPGGTPLGEAVRGILQHDTAGSVVHPEAEALLFVACRAQLVRSVIRPALQHGAWVICDRFMDSTVAYQGYARGLGPETMMALNEVAVGETMPDITLLLDIDVRRGFERIRERNAATGVGHDRIEREELTFHEKVRAGYLDLARKFPERFVVINTDRDADLVASDLWRSVQDRMNAGGDTD